MFTDADLVLRKQRVGPQGTIFPFDAREVPMGKDSYGEPLTSRIIDWNVKRSQQKPQPEKRSSAQAMLEEVLAEALDQHGTIEDKAFSTIFRNTYDFSIRSTNHRSRSVQASVASVSACSNSSSRRA